MELKIYNPTNDEFLKSIEWNHEEIKAELKEKIEMYNNLVYTDEQVSIAKSDRAKLNKFIEALETKRKEIKKQCLAPYENFEKQIKELVAIVNEPVMLIDKQVKAYEDKLKEDKLVEIRAYWDSLEDIGDCPMFDQIFNPKWLNASTSLASVKKEINGRLEEVKNGLSVLSNLPEYSFEATDIFKKTLNVAMAMAEANRLADVARRKKEEEEAKAKQAEEQAKLEAQKSNSEPMNPPVEDVVEPKKPIKVKKLWVGFEAYVSKEDIEALKVFFSSRNIQIRKPQGKEE